MCSKIPISLCKPLRYRFYLPPGTSIQTTTDTITLNSAQLYIKYADIDTMADQNLKAKHTHTKVFPIVDYTQFSQPYTTTTANTRIITTLQNSKGNVMGLLYLLRRTGTAYLQTLLAISDHSILDQGNSPIGVRNYKSMLLLKDESEEFADIRLFRALNFYFKSFSSYPELSIRNSNDTGGLVFSTDTYKLEINPPTSANPVDLVIYTYRYGYLMIDPDGSVRVTFENTS
jgi:hypothetical protein